MPPPEEEHRAPHEPGTPSPSPSVLYDKGQAHDTAAELEALVFATAARDLLDHMLIGDVLSLEAIRAARRLLDRAERFALAT
jgi:hypothetical protein